jgi:hypothetical protein
MKQKTGLSSKEVRMNGLRAFCVLVFGLAALLVIFTRAQGSSETAEIEAFHKKLGGALESGSRAHSVVLGRRLTGTAKYC